jgi:flagellar biosynthesis/type III secretory pathway M-ring protein FliF/YscJ
MGNIHKLPFLLGAAAAIIVGVMCNLNNIEQQDTYIKMAIAMVIFFAIGILIRNTLLKINEEIENKKLEEERRIKAELDEEKKAEEERKKHEADPKSTGTNIDLKVDDMGEDFSPLTVSEYIKSDNK